MQVLTSHSNAEFGQILSPYGQQVMVCYQHIAMTI
jgi:hypothetical protein